MHKTIIRGLACLLLCWCGTSQATPTADARAVHAHGVVQASPAVSPDGATRSPSIPINVVMAQAVVAATIVLGAVALLFLIGYSGTPTIPPTNETTARLYGFSIFWITLSALALLNAFLILNLIGHTGSSPARVAAAAFLLMPALSILGAYGLAHRRLLARLRREAAPDRADTAGTTPALIQQLRQEMAIRRAINVLTMRQANRSPYVFSSLWGPAWLVLPANFDAMTLLACDHNPSLSQALRRLVCAHELAHVKGGDVQALPLVRAFTSAMPACTLGLFAVLLGLRFSPDQDLHMLINPLGGVWLLATLFGFFLIRQFMNARENMADGAATLCVAPDACRALVTAPAGTACALERLIFTTTDWSRGSGRRRWPLQRIQFSFSAFMRPGPEALAGLIKQAQLRGDQLIAKRYVTPTHPANWLWGILLAGLSAAFLQILMRTAKLAFFHQHLLTHYGQLFSSFLKGMESWSSWVEISCWATAFSFAVPALVGISAAFILLLPLRDAFADVVHMRTRQGLVIMGAILLTIVVFSVATDILAGIGRPDLPLFPALRLSGPFSHLAILLAGTLLLACMNLKWSVLASDVHRFLLMLFPELLPAFVPWGIILVFFRGLPMQTRFLLMLFQALLAGVLMNTVFLHRLSREAYVRAEWLEYDRLLWWRRLYTRSPYDAVETHRTVWLHLRKGFFNYALLGLLLAAALYPWLCHQDSWFLAHQGEVAAKVSEWSNIRPSGWIALRDYFWPYLMLSAAQNNLPVSAGILLLAICLSFPCLFIVLGFSMVINSNIRWTIIERVPLLDRISKLTGDRLVGDALKEKYAQTVLQGVSDAQPYIHGFERTPYLAATCTALAALSDSIPIPMRQHMEQWVQRCAQAAGGYGFAPGAPPDLLHTHAAVRYLMPRGLLDDQRAPAQAAWLQTSVMQGWAPGPSRRSAAMLLNARLALEALSQLNPAWLQNQTDRLVPQLMAAWRASLKTVEDTYNLLMALQALPNAAVTDIQTEIRAAWPPLHEQQLAQLDPKSRLTSMEQMLQILVILYPLDFCARSAVRQVIDTLTKAYA